jgi:hypothetical protein
MDALTEGQKIRHSIYGEGVVTESNEDRTTIDFDDHGPKKFVTSLMTAEVIGDAPAKPRTRRRRKAAKPVAEPVAAQN